MSSAYYSKVYYFENYYYLHSMYFVVVVTVDLSNAAMVTVSVFMYLVYPSDLNFTSVPLYFPSSATSLLQTVCLAAVCFARDESFPPA